MVRSFELVSQRKFAEIIPVHGMGLYCVFSISFLYTPPCPTTCKKNAAICAISTEGLLYKFYINIFPLPLVELRQQKTSITKTNQVPYGHMKFQ